MNQTLYELIRTRSHHIHRIPPLPAIAKEYSQAGLSAKERMTRRFEMLCAKESPVILDGSELIVFTRTVPNLPDIYTEAWQGCHLSIRVWCHLM